MVVVFPGRSGTKFGTQRSARTPSDHPGRRQVAPASYPAFTPGYPWGPTRWDVTSSVGCSGRCARRSSWWLSLPPCGWFWGIVVGIGAGWSDRFLGRLCDGLITAALSVPTLIAALIVITAVGFRFGIWSFVAGLTVTGWAETAQLVRERTRTVKAQEAVEAARALESFGRSDRGPAHPSTGHHPMIWMLLAFEVSHAVVTTAGLGFLGYYLGGPIFAEVDDFVYRRISEMPRHQGRCWQPCGWCWTSPGRWSLRGLWCS